MHSHFQESSVSNIVPDSQTNLLIRDLLLQQLWFLCETLCDSGRDRKLSVFQSKLLNLLLCGEGVFIALLFAEWPLFPQPKSLPSCFCTHTSSHSEIEFKDTNKGRNIRCLVVGQDIPSKVKNKNRRACIVFVCVYIIICMPIIAYFLWGYTYIISARNNRKVYMDTCMHI